jgi:hypothetical protein
VEQYPVRTLRAEPAETIAGAGHFLQDDKGVEIGERIARWLAA